MMRVAGTLVVLAGICSGVGACTKDTGVVISIVTDLQAPDELASVALTLSKDGESRFTNVDDPWQLGPGSPDALPGTFAVFAAAGTPDVGVEVVGLSLAGEVIVRRQASLTLIAGETLLLRMALTKSCVAVGAGGTLTADCGDTQTCIEGRCRSPEVNSAGLPHYQGTTATIVDCQSSSFINTSTGALVVAASGSCAAGQSCQEGSCLAADDCSTFDEGACAANAALGCQAGTCPDCVDDMGVPGPAVFTQCLNPGEMATCTTPTQSCTTMTAMSCRGSNDCPQVCFSPDPEARGCDTGNRCDAPGTVCDVASDYCLPLVACAASTDCPAQFDCQGVGADANCQRRACHSDADCADGGFCVRSPGGLACYTELGTCGPG